MSTLTWSSEYSVGVETIDAQHERLFVLTAALANAIDEHRSQRVMRETMAELVKYTVEHFAFEEMMMEQAGYPELERHKVQHRRLVQKVGQFQREFEVEHRRIGRDVHRFLQAWLTRHILEDDKAYAPALAGTPVEP